MKGYWLIMGEAIADAGAQAEYGRLWAPIGARYKARLVTGAAELLERRTTGRVVIVEFPDITSARACFDDPDYQAAAVHARKASKRELVIFEGELSVPENAK